MKFKYILGITIIVVFVGFYAGFFFTKSLTPYVSFEEARKSDNIVQIIGDILHQETSYDLEKDMLYFTVEDKDKNKMKIEYSGVKPGNFEQATTAVVIGKYKERIFVADKILVKCPSKYQGVENQ